MRSFVFIFNLPNPSSRTMAPWSVELQTEMSIRNIPAGKGRPAREADVTVICEPIVKKNGSLNISQSYVPSRLLTGIALLFLPSTNHYYSRKIK
jgi:hypothetical protein